MNKFKVGDFVIFPHKPSEVLQVTDTFSRNLSGYNVCTLSNGWDIIDKYLELWNPKTDLEGGYEIPKNGLVFYDSYAIYRCISECAYYLWLNGSEDTERNWLDAVALITENKC